ncbi:DUF3310 domain-containing protein [Staphylococcus arlettae]|uniref:DUF3310 domain-containing protein n=1 Tax=Staphylococcus arlettae TaxID=29378 RepID=UPI0028A49A75|nr:DUF3310 domain-containing protein [Staphylococcus arlettae]MDT4050222.1 DUF3310 domain-containing protein [Staphylococcus arlettae]
MKIRDLDKGRYIVVYDMGKSEYSEGMTVVGQVVELIFNDEDDNAAIIQSMPFQRYTVTDDNYFDYWNDYMENKTERVGNHKRQSNDVQQRKRNDTVNHPSHYNYGEIEVIDFIEQVTQHYNPNVAYHIGNAIKYIARSPHKNGKEDVAKAKWYIERAFENWDVK